MDSCPGEYWSGGKILMILAPMYISLTHLQLVFGGTLTSYPAIIPS